MSPLGACPKRAETGPRTRCGPEVPPDLEAKICVPVLHKGASSFKSPAPEDASGQPSRDGRIRRLPSLSPHRSQTHTQGGRSSQEPNPLGSVPTAQRGPESRHLTNEQRNPNQGPGTCNTREAPEIIVFVQGKLSHGIRSQTCRRSPHSQKGPGTKRIRQASSLRVPRFRPDANLRAVKASLRARVEIRPANSRQLH